ncbi:MAG: hypothetical protein ACYCZT_02885 [Thiobacillus sp.]
MNNLLYQNSLGRTVAGTMVGILAATTLVPQLQEKETGRLALHHIKWNAESATVGNLESLSGGYFVTERDFAHDIAEAYELFARNQRSLDSDIAEIVSANLWTLYAR